jgi:hypothetical protein
MRHRRHGGNRLQIGPQAVENVLSMTTLTRCQRQHRYQRLRLPQPPLFGLDLDPVDGHGERSEQLDTPNHAASLHSY